MSAKKALLGLLIVVIPAFAQFDGAWEAKLRIVPSVELERCTLTLNYKPALGWTLSSISEFGAIGLVEQKFGAVGYFGPVTITAGLSFNPSDASIVLVHYPEGCDPQTESYTLTAPAYKEAWFKTSLTLAGAELSLELHHWAYPYHLVDDEYHWPCCPPQTESYTLLTMVAGMHPLRLKVAIADCCAGFSFLNATLALTDVALCCGLTYNAELYLTKRGFEHLSFTLELGLCCGFSLEVTTKFTVDEKKAVVKPKWVGLGQACLEIYSEVLVGDSWAEIVGLEIYGYKLRCDLSPCSFVEAMTALDVDKLERHLGKDIFQGPEFEYFKVQFCGPGCCGGTYTLALSAYFQPSGTLFGFSRIVGDLSAPIMANFDLLLSLGVKLGGGTEFSAGWIFRF